MDAIIKKYEGPSTKEKFEEKFSNRDFLGEDIGMVKMAKDLFALSNQRLVELKSVRAPQK